MKACVLFLRHVLTSETLLEARERVLWVLKYMLIVVRDVYKLMVMQVACRIFKKCINACK